MNSDGKYVILVVDDDANLREIVRAKFEASGFVVVEAKDGKEGVQKVKEDKPDLVLMDVQMPNMTGVESLFKIKSDPEIAGTKVLFLTNYGEENTADQPIDDKFAKDAGALGHVRKTDDLSLLVERVKKELGL